MEMARVQESRGSGLPDEANTKAKLKDEPKTAVKDNSEVPLDMNNLEKIEENISYEEYCTRKNKTIDVKKIKSSKRI